MLYFHLVLFAFFHEQNTIWMKIIKINWKTFVREIFFFIVSFFKDLICILNFQIEGCFFWSYFRMLINRNSVFEVLVPVCDYFRHTNFKIFNFSGFNNFVRNSLTLTHFWPMFPFYTAKIKPVYEYWHFKFENVLNCSWNQLRSQGFFSSYLEKSILERQLTPEARSY